MGPCQPGGSVGLWHWPQSQDARSRSSNRKQEAGLRAGRSLERELAPGCRACWLASTRDQRTGQQPAGLVSADQRVWACVWV